MRYRWGYGSELFTIKDRYEFGINIDIRRFCVGVEWISFPFVRRLHLYVGWMLFSVDVLDVTKAE